MALNVVFKNLKKSNFIQQAVEERLAKVMSKFKGFRESKTTVIVSMDNSPRQAGVDQFTVKLVATPNKKKPVILEKKAEGFYEALAQVSEKLLEVFERSEQKSRQLKRSSRRAIKAKMRDPAFEAELDKVS